jgi:hypothetical protein
MALIWSGQVRFGPPPPHKSRKRKRSSVTNGSSGDDDEDNSIMRIESSADERKQSKVKARAPKRRKPPKAVMQLPMELEMLQNASSSSPDSKDEKKPAVQFKNAVELLKDAPYLNPDMKNPARCLGPSDAKKQADQADKERLFAENPTKRPELEPTFLAMLKKLPICSLNQQVHGRKIPASELLDELKKSNVDLAVLSAEHEQELLVEAGDFGGGIKYPACLNGKDKCACYEVSRLGLVV